MFRKEKKQLGSYLQKEGAKSDKIYIIMSGEATIRKKVHYINEYDQEATKDQPIMRVGGNDVIGEDGLWYNRSC